MRQKITTFSLFKITQKKKLVFFSTFFISAFFPSSNASSHCSTCIIFQQQNIHPNQLQLRMDGTLEVMYIRKRCKTIMYGNNIKDTSVHKQDFEHQSLGFSFTTNCLCLYLQCGFIFLPNTNKSFGLEEPQAAKPIFT